MRKTKDSKKLNLLLNLELIGVTFIHDYIQFLFDDPIFNLYTPPLVNIRDKVFQFSQDGYYDKICSLIGKRIIHTYELRERLILVFDSEIEIIISLKQEDRVAVEAAMLRMYEGGQWIIW